MAAYTINPAYPPRVIPVIKSGSGTLTNATAVYLNQGSSTPTSSNDNHQNSLQSPLDLVFYDGPPVFVSNGFGKGAQYSTANEIGSCRSNLPMTTPVMGGNGNPAVGEGYTFLAAFENGLYVVARSYSSFTVEVQ